MTLHATANENFVWLVDDAGHVLLEIHDPLVRKLAEAGENLHEHARALHEKHRPEFENYWRSANLGLLASWVESREVVRQ